jgi:hypothetical protein
MPTVTHTPTRQRTSLLVKIIGGALLATILAAVTIALWPPSEADKAYDDGVAVGQAAADVYYADSQAEAEAALADLDAALVDSREHAGDAVSEQAADQADALERAVDGYVGSHTTTDDWDAELYQYELDVAVDDLADNADHFRTNAPEVNEAFWNGVDDGLNGI